jgi:hypothetical protein
MAEIFGALSAAAQITAIAIKSTFVLIKLINTPKLVDDLRGQMETLIVLVAVYDIFLLSNRNKKTASPKNSKLRQSMKLLQREPSDSSGRKVLMRIRTLIKESLNNTVKKLKKLKKY